MDLEFFNGRAFGEVLIIDEGRFDCLVCKAERSYQLREWRHGPWRQMAFPGIPLFSAVLWLLRRRGWFVCCDTCENFFHLPSLDASGPEARGELLAKVPAFVRETTRVRRALPVERDHSLEDLRERAVGKHRNETLAEYLGQV